MESMSHIKASPDSGLALTSVHHKYEVLALLLGSLNPLSCVSFVLTDRIFFV